MNKYHIITVLAAAFLVGGCSKENPFGNESAGEGQILKSALAMDIKADAIEREKSPTRADVNLDDFTVIFTQQNHSEPVAKYRYGDMPDVVTLPAGNYTCTATYGELREAEWESPYFLGVSEAFDVNPYEITSYIEPIECTLENIQVTVDFDFALRQKMSKDSYVEVKVGAGSALEYSLDEADSGKSGFFMHTSETTLVATFNGKIDGVQTVETKSLKNIQKGCHYNITFRLHPDGDNDSDGDITADLTVDASVSIVDVTRNVTLGDEPLLDDSERPTENPDDPTLPDDPKVDPPVIVGRDGVKLDGVNDGNTLTSCVVDVTSSAEGGITGFTCDIVSGVLTPEELISVGLTDHLDLVNTSPELAEQLEELGLPHNVGGQSHVTFDITTFLSVLSLLDPDEHHFVMKVTDANGSTTKTLIIKF